MGFVHRMFGTGKTEPTIYKRFDLKPPNWWHLISTERFFIFSLASEIFANFSGTSLIFLLWQTGFFGSHGIYIVLCKVSWWSPLTPLNPNYLLKYLGMILLVLHIMKKERLDLNLKERILMIIFAPFSQMVFLASYFYFWRQGNTEQQVEWMSENILEHSIKA